MATKDAVTAAHNKCFNESIFAAIKHRKRKSSLKFVEKDQDVAFKTIFYDY
jgi:hypothetical protein